MRPNVRLGTLLVAGTLLLAPACGHAPRPASRHGSAAPPARASVSPTASTATATPRELPTITAQAFGMHWLDTRHAYPRLPFNTARIWDMGVTWADLQPTASTSLTDATKNPALAKLDRIVATFRQHHVQPMLTLGMTPAWAARQCDHVVAGQDWGIKTCAPRSTGASGPWGRYVAAMASRYRGEIRYFETWNEPSLHNGYNDSVAVLGRLQQTAYEILHSLGHGQQLVLAGIPFTNGPPSNGLSWLDTFFKHPGGTSFDIVGIHLYPSDASARAGDGPEWAYDVVLPPLRLLLARDGVGNKPIWNTETNVGRISVHTGYGRSRAGAAAVARTYLLAAAAGVARTIWYGADDQHFGGTWLEEADFATVSTAGLGYITVRQQLVGRALLGCTTPPAGTRGTFTCRFGTSSGELTRIATWTTGRATSVTVPAGVHGYLDVVGAKHAARPGTHVRLTGEPIYFVVG